MDYEAMVKVLEKLREAELMSMEAIYRIGDEELRLSAIKMYQPYRDAANLIESVIDGLIEEDSQNNV